MFRAIMTRLTASTFLMSSVTASFAAESGITNWPLGVQTIVPAILPAQGETEYYDYFIYYNADAFKNSRGQKSIPGFNLDVVANASRVVHTWRTDTGPWNFSSGIILVASYNSLSVIGARGSDADINSVYVTPMYVTYNTENFHFLFGPSVFVPTPTAAYDTRALINAAPNFVTFNQELAVTYFPTPKLELSAQASFSVNATNPATGYRSGALANIDYAVNTAPFDAMPNLFFGLAGFSTRQFEDDMLLGTVVPGGNRLSKDGLGGQAIYYFDKKTAVVLKYQREFNTRNGPEGNRFWVQFALPLPL